MKVVLKDRLIVLLPQSDEDFSTLAEWKSAHLDHVLAVREDSLTFLPSSCMISVLAWKHTASP